MSGHSQVVPDSLIKSNIETIIFIESAPKFPGGTDSLWCFIEANLDFKILNNSSHQGRVIAQFEIDTTGKMINIETNPEVMQHLNGVFKDSLIENEIKRVLNLVPNWAPAMQKDKPIRVRFVIPFIIPYTNFKCKAIYFQD